MPGRKPEKALARAITDLSGTKDAHRRLALARAISEAAADLERAVVVEARAEGMTWTEIGAVYGMTKQAAQQRFRAAR